MKQKRDTTDVKQILNDGLLATAERNEATSIT